MARSAGSSVAGWALSGVAWPEAEWLGCKGVMWLAG